MNINLSNKQRFYVVETLKTYWINKSELILKLPIPHVTKKILSESLPPSLTKVTLPVWASEFGVNGKLLVPEHLIVKRQKPLWKNVDWLKVIFWYLNGISERIFEKNISPIHSYSFRLKGWNEELWQYAWVNRIALFLRRWAAVIQKIDENILFGALPDPEIILTHDIDAIDKTLSIRIKQSAFLFFNFFKYFLKKQKIAFKNFKKAINFLLTDNKYWHFDYIKYLEEKNNLRSYFFVYAKIKHPKLSLKHFLFDPAYDINTNLKLKYLLKDLHEQGWTIGLHQAFDSWKDAKQMYRERMYLEEALQVPITICRQHWLRFSWEHTWRAQQDAGLKLDITLGFNDRAGFRNGAALQFKPWDFKNNSPMNINIIPLVFMDAHFYNYMQLDDSQLNNKIKQLLHEIYNVHGKAAILWHTHVLSKDYGWKKGFEKVIEYISTIDSKGIEKCVV